AAPVQAPGTRDSYSCPDQGVRPDVCGKIQSGGSQVRFIKWVRAKKSGPRRPEFQRHAMAGKGLGPPSGLCADHGPISEPICGFTAAEGPVDTVSFPDVRLSRPAESTHRSTPRSSVP